MVNHKKNLLLGIAIACSLPASGQQVNASFTPGASGTSFSGKVFLYLSKAAKDPKDEMVGVEKFPCFSISVKNVKPGEKVTFDNAATFYPVKLSDIERGIYNAQVVWDRK